MRRKPFRPTLDPLEGRELLAVTLAPIAPLNVQEGQVASVQASATTNDGEGVIFSLGGTPPDGATINPQTGLFFWMTPHVQEIIDVQVIATECGGSSASAAARLEIRVFDNSPQINAGGNATVTAGSLFTRAGNYVDPDPDTWSGHVDWGDGSAVQSLTLNADHTFVLNHIWQVAGEYVVAVTVLDSQGGQGRGFFGVTVAAPTPAPPMMAPRPRTAFRATCKPSSTPRWALGCGSANSPEP